MSEKKLIEHLRKKKEKSILNIEKNIEKYLKVINSLKADILKKEYEINKLQEQNVELEKKYFMLKEIMLRNGLTFSIINKNYNVKEWDNLYIKIKEDFLVITLKDGTEIKTIENFKSKVLKSLLNDHQYSIVITRIEGNLIKGKLYFSKQQVNIKL